MFLKVALIVIYCNFRCEYTVCCFFFFFFVLFKGRLLIVIWIWSLCFFILMVKFYCDFFVIIQQIESLRTPSSSYIWVNVNSSNKLVMIKIRLAS